MDSNIAELFRRQAEWQKGLKDRPWPEKVRIAEQMRDAMIELRAPLVDLPVPLDSSLQLRGDTPIE